MLRSSRSGWTRGLACLLLCAAGALTVARAASLQITPVTVNLRPDESATAITLSNDGTEPIYGQVRVFRWDQANGDDALLPTQDMVASPPLIQMAPGSRQIIRLLRTGPQAPQAEQSFRVLIDEIAPPDLGAQSGVTVRLRYSVPIFITPGAITPPKMTWTVQRVGGQWVLEARNDGGLRAQVAAVQLISGDRVYDINKGLLGYALAGRTRRWQLSLPPDATLRAPLKLRARINANPAEAAVTLSPAP
ncbi:molecular chaperone [Bordetella sp. N]|uniref:fimbrial biogenesis chaperone n=1 Tax=Bordetella sp. N TaxID=1746199 RepID=UPI000A57BEB3|nr:molecular chaperone [Bordetella sp. N]